MKMVGPLKSVRAEVNCTCKEIFIFHLLSYKSRVSISCVQVSRGSDMAKIAFWQKFQLWDGPMDGLTDQQGNC